MRTDKTQRQTKKRSKLDAGSEGSYVENFTQFKSFFHGHKAPDLLEDTWLIEDLCEAASREDLADVPARTAHEIFIQTVQMLSGAKLACALLKEAGQHGWQVRLEELSGHDFHLDVPGRLIVIDNGGLSAEALGKSGYFRHGLMVSLIRALRDVWQERRHGGFEENYGPEDILMLERVRAADLDVMSVLAAWQMRESGYADLWRHMIGSAEGDMALAFSSCAERDPANFTNGKALSAAFRRWYASEERVNACDHEALEYIDDLLGEEDAARIFGRKKLTPVGLEILSCLPDKSAYLQGQGGEILRDPAYSGLYDPFNQSHFMHVMHDMRAVTVQGVSFSDAGLAAKIFPGGQMTPEGADISVDIPRKI